MSEPSLQELEAERERLYRAAQRGWRLPAGVGGRELAQVREAELRVRAAGSSGSRAAVLVDSDGGAAQGPGAGSWRRSEVGKVRGEVAAYADFASLAERIVGGERGDLRGQAAAGTVAPSGAGRRKRGLCDALAGRRRPR